MLKFPWTQKVWTIIFGSLFGVLTVVTTTVLIVSSSSSNEGILINQETVEALLEIPLEIEEDIILLEKISSDGSTYLLEYESSNPTILNNEGELVNPPSYEDKETPIILKVTVKEEGNPQNYEVFFLTRDVLPKLETVTLTYLDAQSNVIEEASYTQGDTIDLLDLENSNASVFKGWKELSSNTVYQTMTIVEDTVLESVFEPFYDVVFLTPSEPFIISVSPGETLDLTKVTPSAIEGYQFSRFETRENEVVTSFKVDSNTILNAVYTPIYTVDVYGLNGLKEQFNVEALDMLSLDDFPDMNEPGFSFIGFFDQATSGTAITETITVSRDMQIYGRYIPVLELSIFGNDILQASTSVTQGALVNLSELELEPVPGYRLIGFKTLQGNEVTEIIVEKDTTIQAIYQPLESKVQVTLLGRYGNVIKTEFVDSGTAYDLPSQNDQTNYVFKGWNTSIDSSNVLNSPVTVNQNTTFYSQWNPLYDVTIVDSFGTKTTQKIEAGTVFLASSYTPLEDESYEFEGLFNNTQAITSLTINGNTTLTASYDPIHTVSIFAFDTLQQTIQVSDDDLLRASNITHAAFEGYTFKGFKDATGSPISQKRITENQSWIADYEKNTYTATFIIESSFVQNLSETTSSFDYQEKIDLPTLNSENYEIEGIYLDASFTKPFENTKTTHTENLTLYVQVRQSKFDLLVSLDPYDSNETSELTASAGEVLTITPPALEGYLFAGFLEEETLYSQTFVMPRKDVSLNAQFVSRSAIINALNLPTDFNNSNFFPRQLNLEGTPLTVAYESSDETYVDDLGQILKRPTISEGSQTITMTVTVSSFDQSITFTHEATLTPATDEVTVTYVHLNGDTETRTYQKDDRLVLIDGLEYNDYHFEAWYLDASLTNLASNQDLVNDSMTVFAKYAKYHDVTVVFSDGTSSVIKVIEGDRLSTEDIPFTTPEGIEIRGYFNFTNQTLVEESFVVTESTILVQDTGYIEKTITLEMDPELFPSETNIIDFNVDELENLSLPYSDNGTHRITGWFLDEAREIPFDPSSLSFEDFTLYPEVEKYMSVITFDGSGANYTGPTELTLNLGGMVFNSEVPFLEGHQFDGWENADTGEIIDLSTFTMTDEDITLNAVMTPADYQLSLETNGGTPLDPKMITYNSQVGPLEAPNRTGYRFLGWYLDASLTTPFDENRLMPSEDLVVYAKYEPVIYTLTLFDGNDIYATDTYLYDEIITTTLPMDLSKEGSEFGGFDGVLPSRMPASNISLSAVYEGLYEVTFMNEYIDWNILEGYDIEGEAFEDNLYIYFSEGTLFAGGINYHGLFGVTDTSINTNLETDPEIDITQNLNLNIGEIITDFRFNETMAYAYTSQYRLMRWGQLTTDSAIILPEVIDVLESPLTQFIVSDIGVIVITENDHMFAYSNNNVKNDLTRHYLQQDKDIQFAKNLNNLTFDNEFSLLKSNNLLPYGFNEKNLIFYETDSLNQDIIQPFLVNPSMIQLPEGTIYGNILEWIEYEDSTIVIFDNAIVQSDDGFFTFEVTLNYQLFKGETIEKIILSETSSLFDESIPENFIKDMDDEYIFLIPAFLTSQGRLLIPEFNDDGSVISYLDFTKELIGDSNNIAFMMNGVIVLKEGVIVDPFFMYLLDAIDDITDYLDDYDSMNNEMINYSNLSNRDLSKILKLSRISITNIPDQVENIIPYIPWVFFTNFEIFTINDFNYENVIDRPFYVTKIFNSGSELGNGEADPYKKGYETAETILTEIPVHPNNITFSGWYHDEARTIKATVSSLESGNVLYPKFEVIKHRINYILFEEDYFENPFSNYLSYQIDIEPGQIPPRPNASFFNLSDQVILSDEVFIVLEENVFESDMQGVPYDFETPLANDTILYLATVPSLVELTFVAPDGLSGSSMFPNQAYLYYLNYFLNSVVVDDTNQVTTLYKDEALTDPFPKNTIITGPATIYYDVTTEFSYAFLEEEGTISNVAFSTINNYGFNFIQLENGELYTAAHNIGLPILTKNPFNFNEDMFERFEGYLNITSLFDLNPSERIKDFKYANYLAIYHHPFVTTENRIFMTGTHAFTQESFDPSAVILDYEDETVLSVVYLETSTKELWVLLESGAIDIYTSTLISGERIFSYHQTLDVLSNSQEVIHFNVHRHHVLVATEDEFVLIDFYQKTILHHEVLTNDRFIKAIEVLKDPNIDINIQFIDHQLVIVSKKGQIFTYDANSLRPYVLKESIFLLEDEIITMAGNLFAGDEDSLAAVVTSEYYVITLSDMKEYKINYQPSWGDLVFFDYDIYFEDGTFIYLEESDGAKALITFTIPVDLNDLSLVYIIYGSLIAKLSDGQYYNYYENNFESFYYPTKAYRFIGGAPKSFLVDASQSFEGFTDFELEGFDYWTVDYGLLDSQTSIELIEYPTENSYIIAVYE